AHPSWKVVLRPRASIPERFARCLRMIPNGKLDKKDKVSAFISTPLAKMNGISGWKSTNVPVTYATGRAIQVAKSTDGFCTIDIALEKVRSGTQDYLVDGKHTIHLQRYLRVEYKHKGHPLPRQGQRVQIGGTVWWDTDDEWWYEIHPRGPQDVKGLPAQSARGSGR
ncbi:MAG TPA: hypothetical protein VFA18_22670, partial [Gemmataceae bacterium]|nr:hypothetical protein [Gemmataceae bacterium]